MTPDERADSLTGDVMRALFPPGKHELRGAINLSQVADVLASAIRAAENEALERVARRLEAMSAGERNAARQDVLLVVADEIRSLKHPEVP